MYINRIVHVANTMPSHRLHAIAESARHVVVSEQAGAGLVLALSAVLSAVCLGAYPAFRGTAFQLTLQQPFSSWNEVRDIYFGLAGKPVQAPADNLTALVLGTAWCNRSTPRPWVVPANRSDACACLWRNQRAFANITAWDDGKYNKSVCDAAGSDAAGCLRFRSVWDVWGCGDACRVHPLALALTSNLGLCALGLAALLGNLRQPRGLVLGLTAIPLLSGIVALLVIGPVQNFLAAATLLAAWVGIAVGLDGELSPREPAPGDPVPARPLALLTCFWFAQPLLSASAGAYLAVAHTIRDLAGVLCYATLGYLAGLLAQRVHWCRCYLVFGADGGGWALPVHFAQAVQRLAVDCLALALVGVWTGLLVLAYTQWLGDTPYSAGAVSLVLLLILAGVHGLELAAGLAGQALGSEIGRLGWLEGVQIALALTGQLIFTVTAVVDGAR